VNQREELRKRESHLVFEPVNFCFSSLTHHSFPLDIRLLLHDSSGSNTLCVGVLCVPVRDSHRVFEVRSDKVPTHRVFQ
jgi:hypothetical protein